VQGDEWAYIAGAVAVLLGIVLVWLGFPSKDDEVTLLAGYAAEDREPSTSAP
jgi:hypothetical protein